MAQPQGKGWSVEFSRLLSCNVSKAAPTNKISWQAEVVAAPTNKVRSARELEALLLATKIPVSSSNMTSFPIPTRKPSPPFCSLCRLAMLKQQSRTKISETPEFADRFTMLNDYWFVLGILQLSRIPAGDLFEHAPIKSMPSMVHSKPKLLIKATRRFRSTPRRLASWMSLKVFPSLGCRSFWVTKDLTIQKKKLFAARIISRPFYLLYSHVRTPIK